MTLAGILLAATTLASGPAAVEPPAAVGLPAPECVRSMREARLAEQGGEVDGAIATLGEAVERCPEHLALRVALLRLHERHAVSPETTAELRVEVAGWVADTRRPMPDGTLAWLLNNPQLDDPDRRMVLEAIESRQSGIPDDVELIEAAARLHLELDQPAEAREAYGRLLELRPERSDVRWTLVDLDQRLEQWERALALVEPLVGDGETRVGVVLVYAELLGRTGRHETMVEKLDTLTAGLTRDALTELRPAIYGILRDTAWHLWDQGKREPSERIFRRLLEIDPDDAEALAAVRYMFGDPEEVAARQAELERRWAEEVDPQALLDRGGSLLAAGDAPAALEPLRRAAEGLADSEPAWFNLGLAALAVEDWTLAERAFGRAVELNPARPLGLVHRATALERLGRCGEALPLLDAALALEPALYEAHYYAYLCHKAAGDVAAASEALGRYESMRP